MSQPTPTSASETESKPQYDVFLSHHTSDKIFVEQIAIRLEQIELKPFWDNWYLVPGDSWQEDLETALDNSASCAVFLGPEGFGVWQNEEMRDALDQRVRNNQFRVIPVLLPRAAAAHNRSLLPRFLRRLTWVDFSSGLDDTEAFNRLVAGIRGIPPRRSAKSGRNQPRPLFVIVLSGTVDAENIARVQAIADHLQQISGDLSLTIRKIESGSVRLTIECSKDAYERIYDSYVRGRLRRIDGRAVQDLILLRADSTRHFRQVGYPESATISSSAISSREAALGLSFPRPSGTLNYLSMLLHASKPLDLYDSDLSATLVLAESILNRCGQEIVEGINIEAMKRGITHAVGSVVSEIRRLARPGNREALKQIATVLADRDTVIGDLVAEATLRAGREGIIVVEDGNWAESSLEVTGGLRFDRGYIDSSFVTDPERMQVRLEAPLILVRNDSLFSLEPLLPLLDEIRKQSQPLFIIARDIEPAALAMLVINKLRGTLQIAAIRTPGAGRLQEEMARDIASLTGASLISEAITDLGSAAKVIIDRDKTIIIGVEGGQLAVQRHFKQLERLLETTQSSYEQNLLRERLAVPLTVAILKVADPHHTNRGKFESIVASARAAFHGGIVPSMEVALLFAKQAVSGLHLSDPAEETGFNLVINALEDPFRALADDLGEDDQVLFDVVSKQSATHNFDYDQLIDSFIQAGAVDPAKAVCAGIENAASIAMASLKTDSQSFPFRGASG